MRLRSADTFNRLIALLLAWLVPVFRCGSWRLRLLSLLLVLVAVVVARSELEHELVHPPYKSLSRRSELELAHPRL